MATFFQLIIHKKRDKYMLQGDVIPITLLAGPKPPLSAELEDGDEVRWDCVGAGPGLRPIDSLWKSAFMSKEPSLSMDINALGDIASGPPCKSGDMLRPTSPSPIDVGGVSRGKGGWRIVSGLVGEMASIVGLPFEAKSL